MVTRTYVRVTTLSGDTVSIQRIERGVSRNVRMVSATVSGMASLSVLAVTVGGRLAKSRLLADLDQEDMAAALGLSRATISKWERDITEPSVSQFIAWARITKQPVDQLIDGLPGVECTPRDLNPEPTD